MSRSLSTPPKLPMPPRWLLYAIILMVVASWIPLALIARSRATKSDMPRVHLIQDMDAQPKYLAQADHPLFADHRAMRPPVPGAVSRDGLVADDHYYRGFETDGNGEPITVTIGAGETYQWFTGYPEQVEVNRELLERGRERFNIYCAVCHGHAGYGDGMINRRALDIGATANGWIPPVDLHARNPDTGDLIYGGEQYPTGKLFNVISQGIRTMPSYASQIPVHDRWAIVAYVKALQLSQSFPADELPADLMEQIQQPMNSGETPRD